MRPRLLILEIDLRAVTWPRKPLALALKTMLCSNTSLKRTWKELVEAGMSPMQAAAPRCLVGSGVERWLYVVKGNYQAVSVLSVILLSVFCVVH